MIVTVNWGVPETQLEGVWLQSLVHELRQVLPSPRFTLAAALPPSSWAMRYLQPKMLDACIDLFNVKCFDFVPLDSKTTYHNSAMYPTQGRYANIGNVANVHSSLQQLEVIGVPMHKVLLGVSALGRIFYGATGPGQSHEPAGTRAVVVPYRQLPLKGSTLREDTDLGVAYCVDTQGKRFVSYDNALTVNIKAAYARRNNLAGMSLDQAGFDIQAMTGLLMSAYRGLYPPYDDD